MTSVVIVDDHQLLRSGGRAELDGVVGGLGAAARGGGGEWARWVGGRRPAQRFLALSVSDAPEDVIAVIRAGARGYVTKTISGPELADAVRRVAEGDAVFSPRLAGFVLDAFAG